MEKRKLVMSFARHGSRLLTKKRSTERYLTLSYFWLNSQPSLGLAENAETFSQTQIGLVPGRLGWSQNAEISFITFHDRSFSKKDFSEQRHLKKLKCLGGRKREFF